MRWIRTISTEFYGLFVDDGRFALVILLWLAFAWRVLPYFVDPAWQGVLLVVGLLIALGESAWRRARE